MKIEEVDATGDTNREVYSHCDNGFMLIGNILHVLIQPWEPINFLANSPPLSSSCTHKVLKLVSMLFLEKGSSKTKVKGKKVARAKITHSRTM